MFRLWRIYRLPDRLLPYHGGMGESQGTSLGRGAYGGNFVDTVCRIVCYKTGMWGLENLQQRTFTTENLLLVRY